MARNPSCGPALCAAGAPGAALTALRAYTRQPAVAATATAALLALALDSGCRATLNRDKAPEALQAVMKAHTGLAMVAVNASQAMQVLGARAVVGGGLCGRAGRGTQQIPLCLHCFLPAVLALLVGLRDPCS